MPARRISQDWSYNSQADAGSQFYRHVMNRYSDLVMDVPAFSTSPSIPIQIWPRNGGTNQRFNILGGVDARAAASAATPRASESAHGR